MFTFTRVLLFSSCWWRGCRDAHRFTSQLMKTTSCDATEYCRETTQNTRLMLLFSYLRFLFLNVYTANLSLSLSGRVRLGLCCRLLAERQTQRQQQKQKQWSVLAAKNFSFFSVCLAERGWPLTGARDMLSIQRNRERERERLQQSFKHISNFVWADEMFFTGRVCQSCLIRSEDTDGQFPARLVRAVNKTNTPSASVSIHSDLAFNEMRRRLNSFL